MATEAEIKQMKRGELNQLATEYGLNPDDYSRADDLRSAIFTYLKETENKQQPTEESKEEAPAATEEAKKPASVRANPPRPRIERRSKRYRSAHEQIDNTKEYDLEEAVKLAQATSTVKFDAAVELHVNLGVDPKQADQLVRGTIVLPHGSGKTQRVAALVPDSEADSAKKAGADLVGHTDLLDKIGKNEIEFDILVAHPDLMRDLSKHAKTLGPQGLMPSPKAGTVTNDVAKTVKELKGGRIEYRVDRYGIIHQAVGRVSYKPEQIVENVQVLMSALKSAKPGSSKGTYLGKISLTTSMGPSIRISESSLS